MNFPMTPGLILLMDDLPAMEKHMHLAMRLMDKQGEALRAGDEKRAAMLQEAVDRVGHVLQARAERKHGEWYGEQGRNDMRPTEKRAILGLRTGVILPR